MRTLDGLIGNLSLVFVSPNDVADEAPEEDFELAADVDVLEATVVGGLSRRSVSTEAILGGIKETEAILARYESTMTPPQLAAVRDLLSALRSA